MPWLAIGKYSVLQPEQAFAQASAAAARALAIDDSLGEAPHASRPLLSTCMPGTGKALMRNSGAQSS